jgi:PAS domain S-box-containing protein
MNLPITDADVTRFDHLDRFFDLLPVALYRSGPDGSLQAANLELAGLLGFASVPELLERSQDVTDYYTSPGERARWLEMIATNGVVRDFDVELERADGSTMWVRDTARVVNDEDGRAIYFEGALVDVTDKIRLQRSRAAFVAAVSHELRNPIAVVLGLSKELSDRYDEFSTEDQEQMIALISNEADEAAWLIEDLLVAHRDDLSSITLSTTEFDVVPEIRRILESSEADIEMTAERSTMVRADPVRCRQIIRNLVSNAVRYGGDRISIRIGAGDGVATILVCDSGGPIPDEHLQHLFEPYGMSGVSRHPKSVGIGLSVSRRLARLMSGELSYRHDGERSCFLLELPIR